MSDFSHLERFTNLSKKFLAYLHDIIYHIHDDLLMQKFCTYLINEENFNTEEIDILEYSQKLSTYLFNNDISININSVIIIESWLFNFLTSIKKNM